jgi:hypothetical protein
MASVNPFEPDSRQTIKMQVGGYLGINGFLTPDMVTQNPCKGCCDGKGNCKGNQAFVAEASSTSANVSIACTQPPPGVTIQLEPRAGNANLVICTQVPSIPVDGGGGQATNGSDPSCIPSGHKGHPGGGDLPKEAFFSGLSGLLGVLLLLALGSTLWYRRKYQQQLSKNQHSNVANKPKAQ